MMRVLDSVKLLKLISVPRHPAISISMWLVLGRAVISPKPVLHPKLDLKYYWQYALTSYSHAKTLIILTIGREICNFL